MKRIMIYAVTLIVCLGFFSLQPAGKCIVRTCRKTVNVKSSIQPVKDAILSPFYNLLKI